MDIETTLLRRALNILDTKEKYKLFKQHLETDTDKYIELEFVLVMLLILNDKMDFASKASAIAREFCTLKLLKHYRAEEDTNYLFDVFLELSNDKTEALNIKKHIHSIFYE